MVKHQTVPTFFIFLQKTYQMNFNITLIILIITSAVSVMAFSNRELYLKWLYNPYSVYHRKEWHRIFTHALLHGDWTHLIFNMYVLYMFGANIEDAFNHFFGELGPILFILLYIGAIVAATIPAMIKHKDNHHYNSIGASGAVSALIFAGIIFFPTAGYGILLIPFSIPAFIFGPLYLLMEYYLDKRSQGNIAHDAHIWGAIFGFIFPIVLKPSLFIRFIEEIMGYIGGIL